MRNWHKSEIAVFLYKALGIYIIWYLIYDLWLLPAGHLDRWLVHNIVGVCAGLLEFLQYDVYWSGRLIGLNETPGILMVNGCSGISSSGLFIGFVVAYPGRWLPRICFIITGVSIIYLVNIIRILVLTITQKYWPDIFEFTHDYSTTAIFYLVIFVLWMIWVNLGDQKKPSKTLRAEPAV